MAAFMSLSSDAKSTTSGLPSRDVTVRPFSEVVTLVCCASHADSPVSAAAAARIIVSFICVPSQLAGLASRLRLLPRLSAPLRQIAYPRDEALTFGRRDHAARIQQVENVRRLQRLLIRRQRQRL